MSTCSLTVLSYQDAAEVSCTPPRKVELTARRSDSGDVGRRGLLRVIGLGTAAVGASSLITAARASGGLKPRTRDAEIPSPVGGSDEPYPIPWLDKAWTAPVSGSHSGSPPRTIRSWMASAGRLSAECGPEPGRIFD
jgi:hypothetical protein